MTALRGDLLRKELGIFNFKDLLEYYPIRHIDKTKVDKIATLTQGTEYAQVAGTLISMDLVGEKQGRRLVAHLKDDTGVIELVWFQGINWVQKILHIGQQYLVFGKLGFFIGKPQIAHPEIENYTPQKAAGKAHLEPVYPSTEKLKAKGLNGRAMGKFTNELFQKLLKKTCRKIFPNQLLNNTNSLEGLMRSNTFISQPLNFITSMHYAG